MVLTVGDRPQELARAIGSARAQRDVEVELVVVWNSSDPVDAVLDDDVHLLTPGRNLGIPGGRNLGADALRHTDALLFLDDDGELVGDQVLAGATTALAADPTLAVVTLRIVDPDTGATERRHVPRLRVGDPARSSEVTTFLGGACVIRTEAFHRAGGLPEAFFYAHEETSLAWRLLDLGYHVRYEAHLRMHHPAAPPARHDRYHHLSARNRVLLVRSLLPWPLAVTHLAVWALLTVLRDRSGLRAAAQGVREGWTAEVERRPIRWRTAWRMTRTGRPPII